MAEWIFDAPGGLRDFRDPANWNAEMARQARDIIAILAGSALGRDPATLSDAEIDGQRDALAYVDPTISAPPKEAETIAVQAWNGFPRAVKRRVPWVEYPPVEGDSSGIYRAVEHLGDEDHHAGVFIDRHDRVLHLPVRDRQDEYLEWAATWNSSGKIAKIAFVAEGYDYFAELFKSDEGRVLEIYRDFTGVSSITVDDLRAKGGVYRRYVGNQFDPVSPYAPGLMETVAEPGGFNPRNRFNIHPGIVHLSHRANSLGAEVNLAGVSGIARKRADGSLLDNADPEKLLCCNSGGNPNRSSDPLISAQAYQQVLDQYRYTLANPVGLYIAGIANGLLLPDNKTPVPKEWWRAIRGEGFGTKESRVLRLELEVPASEKITISDLQIGGDSVRFPGQIAELLSVHLFVTRWKRSDGSVGPIVKCGSTCCQKHGGDQKMLSDGKCIDGFDLAFPDLLSKKPPALASLVAGVPMRTKTQSR